MVNLPTSPNSNSLDPINQIQQDSKGGYNQIIGQAVSSTIVNVTSGGQVTIYRSEQERSFQAGSQNSSRPIRFNPYKGLLAFQESDSDYFFGREKQIEQIRQKFLSLHEDESAIRLLPIYGPSGSGKSSLVRAGLIPELARRPLPGRDQARVAVLVPGTHPLEALATVLARVATDDLTPVAKSREFTEELMQSNAAAEYDGLRRVANVLPEISTSPLVVLVDQFEEVYTLCKNQSERDIFIENLLCAGSDHSKRVSVIVTMRSDFLGETQKHSLLNRLFSEQGFLVPAMHEEELRQAIGKPAELVGHPLDEATMSLLIEQTEGREGALPLLQFTLTRIWEGLVKGIAPAETLEHIGGVGGALAGEAQRVYDNLKPEEKAIARRVFLGLVQLGEGTCDTRRRAAIDHLVSYKDNLSKVEQVINRFTEPGVRLMTVFGNNEGLETVEVTHEALFKHWQLLNQWLDESRDDLRFQRRLEEASQHWKENGHPEGNLWRQPDLDLLRCYYQRVGSNMTSLEIEFFDASQRAEQHRKFLRQLGISGLVTGLILTTTTTGFAAYQLHQSERQRMRQYEATAQALVSSDPINSLINGVAAVGLGRSAFVKFPNLQSPDFINDSLLEPAFSFVSNQRIFQGHEDEIGSVAISNDGQTIVSGSDDGTIRLWDRQGKPLIQPFRGHESEVTSVAVSDDGQTIVSGGVDGTVRLWNRQGKLLTEPFRGHEDEIRSIAISHNGQTIVSGSIDRTVRLWNRQGKPLAQPFRGHEDWIWSVAISHDGQTIVSGGLDRTVRLWDRQGKPLAQPFRGHEGRVWSVAISRDGQTIVSGGSDGTVRLWDRQGKPLAQPFQGEASQILSVAISEDSQTIVSGDNDGTVQQWSRQGKPLAQPFLGHKGLVWSVAILNNGQAIISGGEDKTVRVWNQQSNSFAQSLGMHKSVHEGGVASVALSDDSHTIASGSFDGTVRLWNHQVEPLTKPLQGHKDKVSIAVSSDGQTIVSGGNEGTVRLWNRQGQLLAQPFQGHKGGVNSVAVSTDGQTIISGGSDGTVRLWNRQGQLLAQPFQGHKGGVNSVAISTNGQTIISGGCDGTVRLWNRQGQLLTQPFQGHKGWVRSVVISDDGLTIVSSGDYGIVRLWNNQGKMLTKPLQGHQGVVWSVAVSPDSETIVSGGNDGTVRLWDRQGQPLAQPFQAYQGLIMSVAVSADSNIIVTGNNNGTVRLWSKTWKGWLNSTCKLLDNSNIFTHPNNYVVREAKQTCEQYVWND
jgi:WD40 repeat protein